ncbi:MAG: circadian clock KaiB family protein [Thermosynechococcaceae cyanobacterium MS004]|nr:circadian clock KaiB family protein [Thermosynechococcaceae cyanobacterium MS004]
MAASDLPLTYKGLALFTPGGDLIYCVDPTKQTHWHVELCAALQQILDLPEVPLFLSDSYTATVDRWIDPDTQIVHLAAAVKPRVWQYRPLLQAIFETPLALWQLDAEPYVPWDDGMIAHYRSQFPQLWKRHNLVLRLDHLSSFQYAETPDAPKTLSGYVLRLFVNGRSSATVQALESLHRFLAQTLDSPYTLRIVDVQQHPELAEKDQITATPTLIKAWPPPVRRLIGTLDQPDRILRLLDLA